MEALHRRTSLVSVKTEIGLVKTFRLILPVAFLAISFWTFEIGSDGQQAVLNYLGQSAKHLFFLGALIITAGVSLSLCVLLREKIFTRCAETTRTTCTRT